MTDSLDSEGLATMSDAAETLRTTMKDLQSLSRGFASDLTGGLKSAVTEGKKLDTAFRDIAQSISGRLLDKALKPLEDLLTSGFNDLFASLSPSATKVAGTPAQSTASVGTALLGSLMTPLAGLFGFAKGGVVSSPVAFSLGGGTVGVAGEAGSEAILPLARGADGRLGVRAPGTDGVNVTFNVTARDAESFRKSEAQMTTMLARAVGRGRRGL